MKRRDIFRVPARVERRSRIAEAIKVGNEVQTQTEDLGWFIVVGLGGKEFAFYVGNEKPQMIESPINLVLEYTMPDNAQS